MDVVVALELTRGLDALPGRRDLDEHALLGDPDRLVESNKLLRLLLRALLVEGQARVDLRRDAARDDGEDLLSELDELEKAERCVSHKSDCP